MNFAAIAQQVERILGKDEVPSSNLGSSSKQKSQSKRTDFFVWNCCKSDYHRKAQRSGFAVERKKEGAERNFCP